MFIALNLVVFLLGYSFALAVVAKPKQFRSVILQSVNKLRFVTNGFRISTPPSIDEKQTLLPASDEEAASITDGSRRVGLSTSNLLTKAQLEARFGQDTWQGRAYADFTEKILARGAGLATFPCVYATMGYRSDDHRYVFLESENLASAQNIRKLAPALLEYLQISSTLGPNTSLVIIGAPSGTADCSVEEYNRSFWEMLRGLRISDPKPWPTSIPTDTEDARWTFCYNGEPVFPVLLTPAHQQRWSRNMSTPVIALQPKWVLDRLLGTPEKRAAAQGKVRHLLATYDTIGISPDLTSYGEAGTSEVRQLCLRDMNEPVECPYRDFDA